MKEFLGTGETLTEIRDKTIKASKRSSRKSWLTSPVVDSSTKEQNLCY